jgi:tRNA(Ile)-lysidine synthetase, N-terminal domain
MKQSIESYNNVLVATSAGSDSMALLDLFYQAGKKIAACYIDHQQRPLEVEKEKKYLRTYCEARNIAYFEAKITLAALLPNQNKQAFFREQRYALLEEVAIANDFNYIATAHHLDDQAETILMRILKSQPLFSLTTINEEQLINHNSTIKIIRPLLQIKKSELLTYCKQHKIVYCEDSSNQDTKYFRNEVRKRIMPIITKHNQKFAENILVDVQEMHEFELFIQAQFRQEIIQMRQNEQGMIVFEQAKIYKQLISLPLLAQRYFIQELLATGFAYQITITSLMAKKILEVVNKPKSRFMLTGQTSLCVQYGWVYLEKLAFFAENDVIPFSGITMVEDNGIELIVSDQLPNTPYIAVDDIANLEIVLAQKDFYIALTNGRKKLNRLYIDKKILPPLRFNAFVLKQKNSNEILFDFLTKTFTQNDVLKVEKPKHYISWQSTVKPWKNTY